MKNIKLYIVLFSLVGSSAFAANTYQVKSLATTTVNKSFSELTEVTIKEVVPTTEEIYGFSVEAPEAKRPEAFLDGIDIDKIILIGEKIIELIKRGAPVVNIKRDVVYAIPKGLTDWQQLTGWQVPVTKVYQVQMKNGFGMNAVDVRVKVSSMYGGSYDGRGQYLANVIVVPTSVKVLWGVTLDLWTENREPVNMGTLASPVAGLGFDIRYKASTWSTQINVTQDYFVTGSGEIKQLQ